MAEDIRITGFRRIAPVQQIGMAPLSVPSLAIRGKEFHDVVDVRINGVRAPEFLVTSPTRLIAEIPRRLRETRLKTVVVLSAESSQSATSLITFQALGGGRASGRSLLTQTFLKILLTTPGTDRADPTLGGGLLAILGTVSSSNDFRAQGIQAVAAAQDQMIARQTTSPGLSDAERLQSADLVVAEFIPRSAELRVQIRLTAMDGSTSDSNLVF